MNGGVLGGLARSLRRQFAVRRSPVDWARAQGATVGTDCRFLGIGPETLGSEPYLVSIGNHVTITSGVRFVTHDGGVWVLRGEHPGLDVFGRITVGNNVFIGLGSIILPGVTIGDDVVIGAGSLVNKDIPSQSVAAGVPAKVVSSLEDYRQRSVARGLFTKGLSPEAKRYRVLSAMPFDAAE